MPKLQEDDYHPWVRSDIVLRTSSCGQILVSVILMGSTAGDYCLLSSLLFHNIYRNVVVFWCVRYGNNKIIVHIFDILSFGLQKSTMVVCIVM